MGTFFPQLRGRGRIYSEMLKLNIPAYKKIVYPDVMITLGEEEFVEDDSMRLANPIVVIEVLPKSTAKYDKTDKFEYYRSIASVQEIVFITQNERFVELYRRQNGGWMMLDIADAHATLHLESVQASISLNDLYA
jgi:Uma2 family endonuclease